MERCAVTRFAPAVHAFNPLKDIDYRRATELVDVLKVAFPEGENTLTKASFEYQVLEALLDSRQSLSTLIKDSKDRRLI